MMDENIQDIDLENNDVIETTEEETQEVDEITQELEELRAYKAEIEKKEAIRRRLAKKQPTNNNLTKESLNDIQEIKFIHKVSTFAEENNLTKMQAERVLKLYPNANAETLKDPFIAEGLKALVRKERVEANTPGINGTVKVAGKTFKEMTPEERKANFAKIVGSN